ncbi:MAG: DeoR/GlpR transcriptional regulator [Planctomycetota bacterium]|nr:MAG: DeoR/GlpR transcriptional regulator [Planctomycetota bacterium]
MNTTAAVPSHQRLERLTALLQEQGGVQVSQVAAEWGISEMTVRRDLQRLADQGLVARVHGGAVVAGSLRFSTRLDHHGREKKAAVRKLAATLTTTLPENGLIYLDGSTTVFHLIEHLGKRPGLQVATNNVDTFHRCAQVPGLQVLLIGGRLNTETDNLVGPMARRAMEGLAFAAAYTSAFGILPELGPCEPSLDDAEVKQLACARAGRVWLAMNHQKFGRGAAATWQLPTSHSTLVSDLNPADPQLTAYRPLVAEIL